MHSTVKFFFIISFWAGLLIFYLTKGKYLIKRAISRIDSLGKRHYIPYPYTYTYQRGSYRSRSKYKTSIASALPWVALVLMIIGFIAMLG